MTSLSATKKREPTVERRRDGSPAREIQHVVVSHSNQGDTTMKPVRCPQCGRFLFEGYLIVGAIMISCHRCKAVITVQGGGVAEELDVA